MSLYSRVNLVFLGVLMLRGVSAKGKEQCYADELGRCG